MVKVGSVPSALVQIVAHKSCEAGRLILARQGTHLLRLPRFVSCTQSEQCVFWATNQGNIQPGTAFCNFLFAVGHFCICAKKKPQSEYFAHRTIGLSNFSSRRNPGQINKIIHPTLLWDKAQWYLFLSLHCV